MFISLMENGGTDATGTRGRGRGAGSGDDRRNPVRDNSRRTRPLTDGRTGGSEESVVRVPGRQFQEVGPSSFFHPHLRCFCPQYSYLNLLKDWFKGILDKDSFDDEAHKILQRDQFRLHNRFLISLLNKCQSLSGAKTSSAGVAEKKKSRKRMKPATVSYDHRFQPASPSEFLCPIQSAVSDSKDPAEAKYYEAVVKMSLCSGDSALPDNFAAHLRMFVNVWESGLDEMRDDAVQLLNLAVRDFMKNIITSLIAYKSSFKTQDKGRFKYCFGAPVVNPLLFNANTIHQFPIDTSKTFVEERTGDQIPEFIPEAEVLEREAMFQVACGTTPHSHSEEIAPLTLWHLFHAMRKYPHCVPSHSVYSVNMNRILNHLHHEIDS